MQHAGKSRMPGEQKDEAAEPAAPISDHFRFSTRDLPGKAKFEIWCDLWKALGEGEVAAVDRARLEGDVEFWGAGPANIGWISVNQRTNYIRSARLASCGSDEFVVNITDRSLVGHSPAAGTVLLEDGGGLVFDHARALTLGVPDRPVCVVRIDRRALLSLLPRNFEPTMQGFGPNLPALTFIKNIVPLVKSKTEPTTPERRSAIGQQIAVLVALMLNPSRDGLALIESRGLKAARLGAVLKAVEQRFADRCFSVDTVAKELGISTRQVHRLLEETTKTFYEHLLERRLLHAYELLSNPLFAGATVSNIAAQAGFPNVTHFNRLFRARFGDTPTGVRASVGRASATNILRRAPCEE